MSQTITYNANIFDTRGTENETPRSVISHPENIRRSVRGRYLGAAPWGGFLEPSPPTRKSGRRKVYDFSYRHISHTIMYNVISYDTRDIENEAPSAVMSYSAIILHSARGRYLGSAHWGGFLEISCRPRAGWRLIRAMGAL